MMKPELLAPMMTPLISMVPILIAAASTKARRRLIDRLNAAQAIDARHAIALDPRSNLERQWVRRLQSRGVIHQAGSLYYLDPEADLAQCQSRRKQSLIALALVAGALLVLGAVLLSAGRH